MWWQALIGQQWKESTRSSVWQKRVAVNIVIGFFILYMISIFLTLGFSIGPLIMKIAPFENPVVLFSSFLIYYLIVELFLRFYMQEVPVLSIRPYLHLPISKSKLVHYIQLKSVRHVFNLLPLLIFIPFTINGIAPYYSAGITWAWLISVLSLLFSVNFLNLYIKRQLARNSKIVIFSGIAIMGLIALEYYDVIALRDYSGAACEALLAHPWLFVFPLLFAAGTYAMNFNLLKQEAYLENALFKKGARAGASLDIAWLRQLGEVGELIGLQIKLIWRNKRPRTTAIMALFFALYGLIFYTQEIYLEMHSLLMMVGIFMTGMFTISYGQFLLGWESGYFDAILTHNISTYQYLRSKWWLFSAVGLLLFILTIPYIYFGWNILLINFAAFCYNIGINAWVVIFFGTINPKKIDLSKSNTFNWQGVNGSQFLMMLPVMGIPVMLYLPFSAFGASTMGLCIIAGLGLTNLLFIPFWLKKLSQRLENKKYAIAQAFRQE